MNQSVIVGAGPAGCAAAIRLAQAGRAPVLIDREAEVGDPLCGGFISWRTAERLRALGVDPVSLGAHQAERLAFVTPERTSYARLPRPGYGLSRHALDCAMRAAAQASGAQLAIARVRTLAGGLVRSAEREWRSDAVVLATGKHDVHGSSRPRHARDPAMGLRLRVPATGTAGDGLARTIELHLFRGGYAGIVLQEDGRANICLAVRKSLLKDAGGDPATLLASLAADHPAFARRLSAADLGAQPIQAIAAVPYGWIAQETQPGLYRVGDQGAVIPSLAGEGMSIAVASGLAAADAILAGRDAPVFQSRFARAARRPLAVAGVLWHLAERPVGAHALSRLMVAAPVTAGLAMRASRMPMPAV